MRTRRKTYSPVAIANKKKSSAKSKVKAKERTVPVQEIPKATKKALKKNTDSPLSYAEEEEKIPVTPESVSRSRKKASVINDNKSTPIPVAPDNSSQPSARETQSEQKTQMTKEVAELYKLLGPALLDIFS